MVLRDPGSQHVLLYGNRYDSGRHRQPFVPTATDKGNSYFDRGDLAS